MTHSLWVINLQKKRTELFHEKVFQEESRSEMHSERYAFVRITQTHTQMIDYQISPQTLLASSNLEHYVIRTVRFSTLWSLYGS